MFHYKLKEIEVGDTETKGGKKTTVSAIDDKTGRIEWDVADVADFSSTYNALKKAKDFIDTLDKSAERTKTDPRIDKFAIDIARLFNDFRSHVRKVYPEEYKKVLRLKESVNEGHGLSQVDLDYLQFIADKNPDDTKLEKIIKFLTKSNILVDKTKDLSKGKEVNEDSSEKLSIMKDENGKFIIGMAKGKYPRSKEAGPFDTQQKACEFFSEKGDILLKNLTEERLNEADINKLKIIGDIYSSCEIPVNEEEGERDVNTIAKYLPKINNKVEWGELLDKILNLEVPQLSDVTKKQALLKVIKQLKEEEVEEGEGIGYLTPNAFGKNKKNVYTSQYGYKLVPKKVKGSGLEVKQLFEKTDRNEFQGKRIAAFKEIEERLNQIYPLLSNAKDETAEYYNENPGSYAIVYSTDYIFELLDEVEAKLKQSE